MLYDGKQLKSELRDFIVTNFMLSEDMRLFTDRDSFLKKGVIDSMGVMELLAFVQRRYQIRVEPAEAIPQNFDSLDHLTEFILKKTEGAIS